MVQLIVILDKSGSMETISASVISGFNEFLQKQRKMVDNTMISLLTFSDTVTKVIDNRPLQEAKNLTADDFKCDGMTALFDAIWTALTDYKGNPDTLVLIITDGHENSSTHSDPGTIRELITQREKEGWKFIYLCNNLDTAMQGSSLGLNCAQADAAYAATQNLCSDPADYGTVLSRQVSAATSAYRSSSVVPNLAELSSNARSGSSGCGGSKYEGTISIPVHKTDSGKPGLIRKPSSTATTAQSSPSSPPSPSATLAVPTATLYHPSSRASVSAPTSVLPPFLRDVDGVALPPTSLQSTMNRWIKSTPREQAAYESAYDAPPSPPLPSVAPPAYSSMPRAHAHSHAHPSSYSSMPPTRGGLSTASQPEQAITELITNSLDSYSSSQSSESSNLPRYNPQNHHC